MKYKKLAAILLIVILLIGSFSVYLNHKGKEKTELKFIFVHGLSGWGSYDTLNTFFPYWGLSQGSIIKYLNRQGYYSYAASIAPTGSAWDRACELYAQLTGTVVDYGEEHSKRCNHERFGKDFSKDPLIDDFGNSKLVLLGHSFGGATIRLFSEILINGAPDEIAYTDANDLSPFFKGGDRDRIFAMITLAAPMNGTTAYDMHEDPSFDESQIEIPEKFEKSGGLVSKGTKAKEDSRIKSDYAAFDMHIDNALKLNEMLSTFDNVYYFSYPCSSTEHMSDGSYEPDSTITEGMFMKSAILMSRYTGTTKDGFVIDETWQSNDGLVNEISAKAPFNAPQSVFTDTTDIVPGVWYIMPTTTGDHMYFQGGMTKRVKVRPFYLDLCEYVSSLYR